MFAQARTDAAAPAPMPVAPSQLCAQRTQVRPQRWNPRGAVHVSAAKVLLPSEHTHIPLRVRADDVHASCDWSNA
ncbi:hypothetical protein EON67_06620 [archaeon]|nr:MAG: hypothetical protein EON67_06620 [archaeon]